MNESPLVPIREDDGLDFHYLDCYITEVNKNDIISVYGKGANGYGESAYTMYFID